MTRPKSKIVLGGTVVFIVLCLFSINAFCEETADYSQTIEVLGELYKAEIMASRNYHAYAKKSES
jgi:hypothetical protein